MIQKFPYIVRISVKAKHMRFQVSVEKGLEIVVPKRFSASRVPSLMEKNSEWIKRAFQKAKAFHGEIGPEPEWVMPKEVTLAAIGLTMEGASLLGQQRISRWPGKHRRRRW